MRCLHVAIDARLPDLGQGGVLSVVKAMTQAFQEVDDAGFRRTWIVLKQADWWREALPEGDKTIEISMPAGSVAAKLPALSSRIAPSVLKVLGDRSYLDLRLSDAEVDLVHLPYQDGVFTELPFVYFPHDLQHHYLPENFTAAQIRHRETRWKRRALSARRVVAAGDHVKRDLVRIWGVPPEKILVYPFPPPVRPTPISSSPPSRHRPYVIYPAVYWPHKNHLSLIEAMSHLKARGLTLQLVLTGAPNIAFAQVMRRVHQLDLTDQVRHTGHVDESQLNELIAGSEAVVLPSLFEAVSLTAYDAIRAGRPLLCSDREFFRAQCGDRAEYFDPLDPVSIANRIEAVTQLSCRGDRTSTLSEAMTRQLSLKVFAENLYKTYRTCVAESL